MLSIVTGEEQDRWDRIVRSFQEYDVYYLSGYGNAFQIHGDGTPVLFYYEKNGVRAVNAAMKRDISTNRYFTGKLEPNTYFDLITPYGYGGYLIEGAYHDHDIEALNTEYTAFCSENSIICEYARLHPTLRNKEKLTGMYVIEDLGRTICIDLESKEFIWNNFTGKNRNMVRKAQKSGVEIFWGRSSKLFRNFIDMYRRTMEKNNAEDYYYFEEPFFDCLLYDLKNNCMVFYAVYCEKIIAMSVILYGNLQMHYYLSASDQSHQNLAPTNLLLYEAACWGAANDYKTFHLGGGLHSREDHLFQFKSAFQPRSSTFYSVGKKCFRQDDYDKLVSIRMEEKDFYCQSTYFPLYRK